MGPGSRSRMRAHAPVLSTITYDADCLPVSAGHDIDVFHQPMAREPIHGDRGPMLYREQPQQPDDPPLWNYAEELFSVVPYQ